jgi:hypothetical protein
MSISKIITLDELTDKIELETTDSKFRVCAESLLCALNDWPTMGLKEPKDLLDELTNEVGRPLTYENLNSYSNGLKITVSGNAWKMESVTSLLEMFDFERQGNFDKTVTLETVIEKLTDHYRAVK